MHIKKNYFSVQQLGLVRDNIIRKHRRLCNSSDRSGMAKSLFVEFIQPIMNTYPPIISTLGSHNGDNLYRARKCLDNNPFGNILDLYNPPTPSGRASADDQVLYASSSMQTCLVEVGPKIGDLVCVAHFDYTDIKEGDFWFIGQIGPYYSSKEVSRYLHNSDEIKKYNYLDPQVLSSLVFLDNLINEIFSTLSSELDNYELNYFLINAIKTKRPDQQNFNGMVFLSTKDAPGLNFAISGKAITKLKPTMVNLLRITDIDDYGSIGFHLLKNVNPNNSDSGQLEWPDHELPLY